MEKQNLRPEMGAALEPVWLALNFLIRASKVLRCRQDFL
jgi:hypothetical protein